MHPELVRRFHEPIRDEAARRYGLSATELTRLAAFENYVYEGENADGDTVILKIADTGSSPVKIRVARSAITQVEAAEDAK